MSKPSKSERKEDRIQQLERELSSIKKKNAELQQQKTIYINDEQMQNFLDDLTKRVEWSTNRIVDEMPRSTTVRYQDNQINDGFSVTLKLIMGITFITASIVIAYHLFNIWGQFWSEGWATQISLIIIAIADIDCLLLGIEIFKEKDRNYIVSLFSALIALVALIVTLIK